MKNITINPLEIEPETIVEISEEQAEQIEGGGSCYIHSCIDRTKEQ